MRAHPKPTSGKGATWTQREDMICLNCSLKEACRRLPKRTRGSIATRAYTLRHNLDKRGERDGVPWSTLELKYMREYYSIMKGRELQRSYLPERSLDAIINKARLLGLRKKHRPTDNRVLLPDHPDLDEQIRMRAREDRIAFRRLDKELKTGNYFSDGSTRTRKMVNLSYISRAVLFFGGKLIIDWQDR